MISPYISQIIIYPIKSLGGISISSAQVLPKGLAFDRRWMLIDETGRFLSQRCLPLLALFQCRWLDGLNGFKVLFRHHEIAIPFKAVGTALEAKIWEDHVVVQEVDSDISRWFTEHLKKPVKLVFFPEDNPRLIDPDYALDASNHTSLSDGFPLLIIGQASLDDLNCRLPERVGMDRFRPNLVFEGGMPYEEDGWRFFQVGAVPMAGVKPCARCIITTLDAQTGTFGKEPLATLGQYRKRGNKVLFGQNVIPQQSGTVHVGDTIKIFA